MGRALAYHGADVLNIWQPTSFEMDFNYYTANVGIAPYVNVNATARTYVDNWTYWPTAYRETEEFRERMAENPAARLATGRECAQTVLFLAGPESDFFYGQIIPFAGGWTV
jgi:NAD(P)-dependent dehydrogenase (short-subunit alcohol dehydrogenase family)